MILTILSCPIFSYYRASSRGLTVGHQGPESESSPQLPPDLLASTVGSAQPRPGPTPAAPALPWPPVRFTPSWEAACTCPPASSPLPGRAIRARGGTRPLHTRRSNPRIPGPGWSGEELLLGSHSNYPVPKVRTCLDLINQTLGSSVFSFSPFAQPHFQRRRAHAPLGSRSPGKRPGKRPAPHPGVPPGRVREGPALRWARARESWAGRISRFQDSQQQKQFIASSIRLSVGPQIHETLRSQGLGASPWTAMQQTVTGTASPPPGGKGQKGVKLRESAHPGPAGPARRGAALGGDAVPLEGREARPGAAGRSRAGWPGRFSSRCLAWTARRAGLGHGRRGRASGSRAAGLERSPDPSLQPLVYGNGRGSLR